MTPRSTDELRREEAQERERHDVMYAEERDRVRDLAMVPWDWEKFDRPDTGNSAYLTSVHWLGDIRGKTVLDLGCGTGWFSVILAKRGAARVDGFDISGEAVAMAGERAEANGVGEVCRFKEGSAYEIPFSDQAYDVVAGQAIIHHLRDKEVVARELDRVMRSGAVAAFNEPFGDSPVFERLRQALPFRSDTDDPDHWMDKVTTEQIEPFRGRFDVRVRHFELLFNLSRYARFLERPLANLDRRLLAMMPPLRRVARGVVIGLQKP
ncbi:MAG: class I SAM-dependent methyltransferase [Longimicrobiales bacterium]